MNRREKIMVAVIVVLLVTVIILAAKLVTTAWPAVLDDVGQSIKKNTIGLDSGWFWTMAQCVIVAISLYFICIQLKIQRIANMLSTLAMLQAKWKSDEILESRRHVCSAYPTEEPHINAIEEGVLSFFEEIGIYLKMKVMDLDTIWDVYSYYVTNYWPILSPRVYKFRTEYKDESWYCEFEQLHKRIVDCSRRQHGVEAEIGPDDISKFIRGELEGNKEHLQPHPSGQITKESPMESDVKSS